MERMYAGVPEENAIFENTKVMFVTVPYGGISTWGKGANKEPELLLDASENMELCGIETDTKPRLSGAYLVGEISENSLPEVTTEATYQKTRELLKNEDKLLTLSGGEYSVSTGSIRAVGERHEKLVALQLDVHTDSCPGHHGPTSNYTCAVFGANQKYKLVQIGTRSVDVEEKQYLPKGCVFFACEIAKSPN